MRVVSVNVGLPRAVAWRAKTVTTAIFKEPVAGRVALRALNLDGDRQAGENLTTDGLREDAVHVGDRFRVGSAELLVTQPRLPCYKLGIRFGRADMVKRFLASGRTGFYFAVLREGEVGAGDAIHLVARDELGVSIAELTRLYVGEHPDHEVLRRVIRVPALPASWRAHFLERLEHHG